MKELHSRFLFRWLRFIAFYFCCHTVHSQSLVTVIDETGQALIGVNIEYLNQKNTTNLIGQFEVTDSMQTSTVFKFKYLGYHDLRLTWKRIQKNNFTVALTSQSLLLDEVMIVGRTNARPIDLPYQIERISSESIIKSHAQNSADALTLSNGIYIQKSQMGGGSPSLRGFEANKVLLVVDGVRMNNAIYRNGHLQNAITIDPSILDQVEVVFGAGSLLYGSEALGGVIHFRSISPMLNFQESVDSKELFSSHLRYNSANHEKKIHFDYTFSKRKFGVLTSVTFTDFSDLRTGSRRSKEYPDFGKRNFFASTIDGEDFQVVNPNPNIQVGTAYSQYDILQKWAFMHSDKLKTELNVQYSNTSNIPRYDNLTEFRDGFLRYAEWFYGPQERLLISPKLTYRNTNSIFDKLSIITSFQKISEDRIGRNFQDIFQENQEEDVVVFGATADFNKRINDAHKLSYGLDIHHNEVQSNAFSIQDPHSNLSTKVNNILTRYPSGGSQLTNFGIYIQENWQNADSTIIWINGLRWTTQNVNFIYHQDDVFEWPSFFYDGIGSKNSALVGISGANFVKGAYTLKLSTGNSFRSPNVDDLAKIRVNGNEITVPNVNLKSEKVWNNEISIEYKKSSFSIGLTGYYTLLSDVIINTPFSLPNGEELYVNRNDTLVVTGNVNSDSGVIKGVTAQLAIALRPNLLLTSGISFQAGSSKDSAGIKSPLAHIPPTFGRVSLEYNQGILGLQINWKFNTWKHIDDFGGSVDNPEFATIDGSPSWNILGLNSQITLNPSLLFSLGIDNIFDLHYRQFASGLSAPGRHIVTSIRYDIK